MAASFTSKAAFDMPGILTNEECIMKFICVRLLVKDFPATFKFWRDLGKLPVSYSDEATGYAYFDMGTAGLELFSRAAFASAIGEAALAPLGREAVLDFEVDDVDATYADLVARGATPVAAPQDRPAWGARTANLADPDGHHFEIYTKLPANKQ
jgi:lactoylglutathione lyase